MSEQSKTNGADLCAGCGVPFCSAGPTDLLCDDCDEREVAKWREHSTEAAEYYRAQIATLTHRAEAAEASASLWRERCNKAEARVAAYQREIHRIACGEQVEGDGLCEYGIEAANLRQENASLRAKLARAEGVVAAARAVAREHDRYLSDEVGPMGHVDEACDALRAALATYEKGSGNDAR